MNPSQFVPIAFDPAYWDYGDGLILGTDPPRHPDDEETVWIEL